MPSLSQVLVLESVESSGLCFRHFARLPALRVLRLGGAFAWSRQGLACLAECRLPELTSLRLATCT